MSIRILLLTSLLGACALPPRPVLGPPAGLQEQRAPRAPSIHPGILSITLGARALDDSRWDPFDDMPAIGLDYTYKDPGSWLGLHAGLQGSAERETIGGARLDAWTGEVTLGPRVYMEPEDLPFYAYAGAAVALGYSDIETTGGASSGDTFFGGVASLGLMFEVSAYQAIGVEWRILRGSDLDTSFVGGPEDADHQQLSFVFSARF